MKEYTEKSTPFHSVIKGVQVETFKKVLLKKYASDYDGTTSYNLAGLGLVLKLFTLSDTGLPILKVESKDTSHMIRRNFNEAVNKLLSSIYINLGGRSLLRYRALQLITGQPKARKWLLRYLEERVNIHDLT